MMNRALLASVLLSMAGTIAPAHAALVIYSGSDIGAGSADPRPNSDATAADFDAAAGSLGPVSLIDFESAQVGSFSSLDVAPGVTLTGENVIGGDQSIRNIPAGSPDSLFGYNTTLGGVNFVYVEGGTITFTFATPIQAFGAYFSGLQLTGETITYSDGSTQTVELPTLSFDDGGIAFVGFTDAGNQIVSVTINTEDPSTGFQDLIGVDDVRYVSSVAAVPEPSTLALAGLGGLGLVGMVRRKRRTA